MKIEFNLVPSEYCESMLVSLRRRCIPYLPLALICLAAAEFMCFSVLEIPRLRVRLEKAAGELKETVRRTEILAEQYAEISGEIRFWQKITAKAERSVPALEVLDILARSLPETAELQHFTAGADTLQMKVLFADPETPDFFMRRTSALPYGPVRVLERRMTPHEGLFITFEAAKK